MLTMKTRALLAVASALALTAGLATSASAASGYENYQCPKVDYHDGTFVWDCNGLWYAGTPRVRTFRAEVTETYNENTRYESTGAQSITSTDGRKKLVVWYCRYGANTRSTEKGRTQVGEHVHVDSRVLPLQRHRPRPRSRRLRHLRLRDLDHDHHMERPGDGRRRVPVRASLAYLLLLTEDHPG
jgi:hypothetical protein